MLKSKAVQTVFKKKKKKKILTVIFYLCLPVHPLHRSSVYPLILPKGFSVKKKMVSYSCFNNIKYI